MVYDSSAGTGLLIDGNQIEQVNAAGAVYINFNSSASTILNVGGGNVGIGVSAPTSALQVSGTFTVSSTVTGISPALYVSTSGNVGIGTSTPTNLFAIHQSEDTTPATVNSYGFRVLNKGSSAVSIGADATYNYIQGWNRPLQINNVGNNTLFNVGGGSAGIGTTSPNATLNVSGSFNVSTSAQTSSNPSLYVTTSGNVGIGTTSPNGLLEVNKNQNGLTEARVINANTGASAQARYTLATGTANAYILSTVLDNSAAPYYQMSAGAGIQNAFFDFPNFKFRSTGGTDWLTVGSSSIAATLPMTITNSTGGWGASRHHPQQLRHLQRDREQRLCGEG